MSPSQTIIRHTQETFPVTDKAGSRLLLRQLTALDTLRLFKAAGPDLSLNASWLSMAGLAFSVLEIDGVPVPSPTTEAQIENLIDRLGDEGLAAIADALDKHQAEPVTREQVGNSLGTLS